MNISDYIVDLLLDHCGHCPEDKELAMGRKVEKEHTDDPKKAEKIAKDHLKEPGHNRYYTRLKKCGLADELKESQSCECRDPGCPACRGKCNNSAVCNLRRIDMMDQGGVYFCDKCASDALEAGVFGGPDVGNFINYHGRTPRVKAPPKADIMPGGSLGGIGDNTAIGVAGGGEP